MSPLSQQEQAEAVRILRNNNCGEPIGFRKTMLTSRLADPTSGGGRFTGYLLVGSTGYVEVTPGMEPMVVGTFHSLDGSIGHGVEGQLNRLVLDVDSEVTGFGTHNRLVVFGDLDGSQVFVREDVSDDPALPLSTEWQRLSVAHHPSHRLHPAGTTLEHVSSEPWTSPMGKSIDHTYRVVPEA